jgi:hypothetical protein
MRYPQLETRPSYWPHFVEIAVQSLLDTKTPAEKSIIVNHSERAHWTTCYPLVLYAAQITRVAPRSIRAWPADVELSSIGARASVLKKKRCPRPAHRSSSRYGND